MVSNTNFVTPIQTNEFLPLVSRWTTFGILSLAIPVAAIAISVARKETHLFRFVIRAIECLYS